MQIVGYTITLKTFVILFILYSIILLNMTWGCCLSPAIESMKNQNQIKENVNKWKSTNKKQNNP